MRRWTGKCQRCFKTSNTYTMSWYSVALICLECSNKEEQRKDIQDIKDADTLDYLQRHNLPTENFKKQIADRKQKEQK